MWSLDVVPLRHLIQLLRLLDSSYIEKTKKGKNVKKHKVEKISKIELQLLAPMGFLDSI